MSIVVLVEIDVTSPAGAAGVLRFSDRAIRPFPPSAGDRANQPWDDRILEAPSLRRALFDDLANLTPGLGYGVMTLANADRALDPYQAHSWGEIRCWRWPEGEPFAAAVSVLSGRCSQPSFGLRSSQVGRVGLALYDLRADLEGPLQATVYEGTNGVGGVLYEGAPDGLKGRVKPLAYGRLDDAHLPAPQVNGAVLAHQLHAGALQGSEAVFDRGDAAGFTDAGNYAGGAFDAYNPAPAAYATDLGRGLLKINGDPVGRLTFGVRGDAVGGYVETTGPILARLLAQAGVAPGRIDASVAAVPSTAIIGAWFGDQISARDALGWVAKSAAVALAPGRDGVWRADLFSAPAGVAAHVIAADEVVDIEADETAPAPAGEVQVGWGRLWTTFDGGELAPALRGTSAEARLAQDYRYAVDVDEVAKARFPGVWRTLKVPTALRSEADAIALAGELKALFGLRADGKPRRMWRVTLPLTEPRLSLQLGATVELSYPPAGIEERFVLVGEEPMRPSRDLIIWTLWG